MDSYLYHYGVGGVVFAIGLYYGWRQGYVGLKGRGLRNLVIAMAGLFFFMVLQGWLQFSEMAERPPAPPAQPSGDPTDRVMGTGLDYGIMIGYFVVILFIGTFFGRGQKSTKDFFFGGQRFAWWLLAFSLVATTVGSYSFVKYSNIAYTYGISSSQSYLNDWFWFPLLVFGWLPILYFSRVTSVPEYFSRRFGKAARNVVTGLLLVYLIGYVGVNLFTMGKALNYLIGWDITTSAALVAGVSAIYVTMGGQTSVIMTDLFQGVMLLACGGLIIWLGADAMGGIDAMWEQLPREHRKAFVNLADDPSFSTVGIFWQDAMANSAMFYFLNQGILMRFMAARSVTEGKRAAMGVLLILMPIAAIVVASGGWVGRSLVEGGQLPAPEDAGRVFFAATEFLAQPGVFGLVMAALTAALMSTVDTLITAIAAVVVNDVYKPLRPDAPDEQLVKVARVTSVGVAVVGLLLVPVFMSFDTIFAAHGAFTAAVTPPLVIALLFGVFWRRFTPQAAVLTMVGGTIAIICSIIWPQLVEPFSHGIPAKEVGEGLFAGAKQYKFTRALFGLAVSGGIGVIVTLVTKPRPLDSVRGLVWGTIKDAIRNYKGREGDERESRYVTAAPARGEGLTLDERSGLSTVEITEALASEIGAVEGDLVYVSDSRRWLGGLRSGHAIVAGVVPDAARRVTLAPILYDSIVPEGRRDRDLRVKRLY